MKIQELAQRVRPHLADIEQMNKQDWKRIVAVEVGIDPRTAANTFEAMKLNGVFRQINGTVFSVDHKRLNELAGFKALAEA